MIQKNGLFPHLVGEKASRLHIDIMMHERFWWLQTSLLVLSMWWKLNKCQPIGRACGLRHWPGKQIPQVTFSFCYVIPPHSSSWVLRKLSKEMSASSGGLLTFLIQCGLKGPQRKMACNNLGPRRPPKGMQATVSYLKDVRQIPPCQSWQ